MTDEQLLEAIGSIRDEFILEGALTVDRAKRPHSLLFKWGVAACLMLTVGLTAWRIADRIPAQPPESTTVTTTMKNATAITVVPETFPESMLKRFPTFTLNDITYNAVGETDLAVDQRLGELTLSGVFGETGVTVYSLQGVSPDEAVGLRLAGSEITYLYQKQSASTDTAD